MPRQPRLSDLQLILLAGAAQRDDGAILPLPPVVKDDERTRRELRTLLRRGFVTAATAGPAPADWEIAENANSITRRDVVGEAMDATDHDPAIATSLVLTDSGRAAIGLGPDEQLTGDAEHPPALPAKTSAALPSQSRASSKTTMVLDLLRSPEGASLAELTTATGWQPHSARAVLSGLRKQSHTIEKAKHEGVTRYAIAGEAQ